MKKLIYILLLNCVVFTVYGQDFYIYVNGQKHHYSVSSKKILIRSTFNDTIVVKNFIQEKTSHKLVKSQVLKEGLMMIELQNEDSKSALELLKKYNNNNSLIYTSPILVDDKGNSIGGITNQVFVRLKSKNDHNLLLDNARKYSINTVKKCDFDNRTFQLTLSRNSEKSTIQIANELYESGLFEYAEPNLIHFLELSTNDQHYTQQWALNNTGQSGGTSGVDIKANQAWSITTGLPNVRIAILDTGVDLTHPDLQANLLPGFDATGNNGNGGVINGLPHGTACAGIAAAIGDNTIGIVGVAYGCRIMPISIATTNAGWTTTESGNIATAIDWARQNGASVISMSFNCLETNVLNTEILEAATIGRNNLGCFLVAASGNAYSSFVSYPANNEYVMAVGANTNNGSRASFSNYGTQLDVVAPGVNIYTTDLQGSLGYNTSNGTNGNYYASFDGTSAATPHVAGVAALILSVRPDLTGQQVRDVIEQTAQKVGGYFYTTTNGRPNGTWNNQMGYGLVNAYAAASAVAPRISGSTIICNQATYTIENLPAGATVQWSIPYSGPPFPQLTQNIPNINQCTITNPYRYPLTTTLTAQIYYMNNLIQTVTKTIVSDDNQTVQQGTYYQERCLFNNFYNPIIQGTLNGTPFFLYQGCLATLTLNNMVGRTVSFYSGWPPSYWYYDSSQSKLFIRMPQGSSGVPVEFRITGEGACNTKSIIFWTYMNSSSFSLTPNPATTSTTVTLADDTQESTGERSVTTGITDRKYTIQLWNSFGLVRQVQTDQKNYQLDLTGIPKGFYYVHVTKDGKTYRKQLIIK